MSKPVLKHVSGQNSFYLQSDKVDLFISKQGGHIAPVIFAKEDKKITPFEVAPWAEEILSESIPNLLKVLRGDFFCMPFGGNETVYNGEAHPPHGETANDLWEYVDTIEDEDQVAITLKMDTKVRPGTVEKTVMLKNGQNVVYQQHKLIGYKGEINPGHHAILKFPDKEGSGNISTSKFVYGQVLPVPFEDPAEGGYFSLKTGAEFSDLTKVPRLDGTTADLSSYPARRGFEDLVMMVSDASREFAWNAVCFPEQGYVWFALKDPKKLRETVFWISNAGRHYEPWNGRHSCAMGIEDVTAYFHLGLAESLEDNPIKARGYPTSLELNPEEPLKINYIMAVAEVKPEFERVVSINKTASGVELVGKNGDTIPVDLDLGFLQS